MQVFFAIQRVCAEQDLLFVREEVVVVVMVGIQEPHRFGQSENTEVIERDACESRCIERHGLELESEPERPGLSRGQGHRVDVPGLRAAAQAADSVPRVVSALRE